MPHATSKWARVTPGYGDMLDRMWKCLASERSDRSRSPRRADPGALAIAIILLAVLPGCGDDDTKSDAGTCTTFAGSCIGVPPGPACEQDFCADGVACSTTVEVRSTQDLAAAASAATAGSCILLAPGGYPAVTLPGGVSLLGAGADRVTVDAVTVSTGSGTVLRGFQAQGIVRLEGATGSEIIAVRITGGREGIQALDGTSVTVADSEILQVADNAVHAVDAARVTLQRVLIDGNGGPGVWAECDAGCNCAAGAELALERVLLRNNQHVGVGLVGVDASFDTVDIVDTMPRGLTSSGGGLAAMACSDITHATALRIERAALFGMVIDNSSADLGAPGEEQGIIIIDSKSHGGLWIQNTEDGQDVAVTNAMIARSAGVGIGLGVDGSAKGIIIIDSRVDDTSLAQLPTLAWGAQGQKVPGPLAGVGDGLIWGNDTTATIQGLVIANSARQSMLIDGAAGPGSWVEEVNLEGADAQSGILQQHVEPGTGLPDMGSNVPAINQTSDVLLDAPDKPPAPAAI